MISVTGQKAEHSYTGRFAPSPSGPLHIGSLIAALASFLDARSQQGRWLLRIEDLDPPRESPEAAQQIIDALEILHLHWDGDILFQSTRLKAYRAALKNLQEQQLVFPCVCSRQDLQEFEGIYPGTCRLQKIQQVEVSNADFAIRCKVDKRSVIFTDLLQGTQQHSLQQDCGDFIIKRKDGLFAYQLAVVIDDAWQKVSHVIRGIDLLDSTPRQIYLQQILNLPQPVYGHIPIIVNKEGPKLSKQHHAPPLNLQEPGRELFRALQYLQQPPPASLSGAKPAELLDWAIQHWDLMKLRNLVQVDENQGISTH